MTPLINCEDSIAASEVARAIFKAEMVVHQRNVCEVHVCLKENMGTNRYSQLFLGYLRVKKHQIEVTKIQWLQKLYDRLKILFASPTMKFIITSLVQIIIYSWDLVKDLYFLAFYIYFGQISILNLDSFDSQVLVVLIMSLVLPNLLNVVVLLTGNLASVPSRVRRLLVPIVFLSVSVTSYALNKIQYIKRKQQRQSLELSSSGKRDYVQSQSTLEQHECLLMSLHAKLKINEGIFESSIQAIILMVTVAVSCR